MKELIYGKKADGKYYVRPINWAGIWNEKGELTGCNVLYEFDTEQECIDCISMNEVTVYKMNDYEWWASKLSVEETEKFYEEEIGEENDIEDIKECDIDSEGMWWETENQADIERLGDAEEIISYATIYGQETPKVSFGNLMRREGEVHKYIPLRIALMKYGEVKDPFCLATTEW